MRSASVMPLVDGEALELVEDREVRRVDRVAPVDAADRDHVDRRPALFHLVDLRRRRLRAEQRLLVEEERVARRARRMPVGEAERVEVVAGRLDLAAVDDLVAEAEEDVLDVAAHERRRVERAARAQLRRPEQLGRQRHVDALGREPLLELGARELLLAGGERRLDRLAHGVERHAGLAVAHVAQRELERATGGRGSGRGPPRARRATSPRQRRRAPPSRDRRDPRWRPYPTVSPPFAGTGTGGGSTPRLGCGGDDAYSSAPTPRRRAGAA